MHLRILDLDGSIPLQKRVVQDASVARLPEWAPRLRMACTFRRFHTFERDLADALNTGANGDPAVTFYGSGDFHHVSLALTRRLMNPFNLLLIDNHPDWMRGVPFLHCGTWLYHAAQLPTVQRIFHVGGDVDFDNFYHWLAPRHDLRTGKITAFPGVRHFQGGLWSGIANEPLREGKADLAADRMEELLRPHRADLASWPLYVSLDKDVLTTDDAIVNWDSGHLRLPEVRSILKAFFDAAEDRFAGMDIVGDWSPVRLHGWFRRAFHLAMHPALEVDPIEATRLNERTNLALLETLRERRFRETPLAA